jgi:GrpB-like predicted nucleotidyltransferase (UPF0157 family)
MPEPHVSDDAIGLKRGIVVLKNHHQEWEQAFEIERRSLRELFGDAAIDIQHIGSTSVPGLAAKPIVDILLVVRALPDVAVMRPRLESAGYEYRENGSDDLQILFAKGPQEKRTHYLHITEFGSSIWRKDLAFRDYLRSHPDSRAAYQQLKEELALQYGGQRAEYTARKRDFIASILEAAL